MFAFRQIDESVAGKDDGRFAIGLRAEESAMSVRPRLNGLEIVIFGEFGEGLAPVVADSGALAAHAGDERRQVRRKIVTSPFLKFREEVARPVGAVYFETVAEDGVRWLISKRGEKMIRDRGEMILNCGLVVVVEDEAFGSDGSALDLLAGAACDEELESVVSADSGWKFDSAVCDSGNLMAA